MVSEGSSSSMSEPGTETGTGNRKKSEVIEALKQWNRVLIPGEWILLAVPHLQAIAALYATNQTRKVLSCSYYLRRPGRSVQLPSH